MFTDTLIESQSSPQVRPRLAALLSMFFQAGVLGTLILVPLLYPGALESFSITPPVPLTTPTPQPVTEHVSAHATSNAVAPHPTALAVAIHRDNALVYNLAHQQPIPGNDVPPSPDGIVGPPVGTANLTSLINTPTPRPMGMKRVVISNLDPGMLLRRVQPEYPITAKLAHVQGDVVLQAVISKTGEITGLQVLSGHPLLVTAAVDAVKQWRYRPYKLNGEAVEVETQVVVRFRLGS